MPNSAMLPAQYEKLVRELEALVLDEGTLNTNNSWVPALPAQHTAAVALLKHHLGAARLSSGQSKIFHARWTEAVHKQILDPIDTCLGRTDDGLQCGEQVPDGEISGLCGVHKDQTLLEELERDTGCAHEAPCQVRHQRFENSDAASCLMCF